MPDQKIAATVAGDRIQIIDHRQCKGCDCPPLLKLTWEEGTQFRLQVHRALKQLGQHMQERIREQYRQEARR